jgi:hypothetical protein
MWFGHFPSLFPRLSARSPHFDRRFPRYSEKVLEKGILQVLSLVLGIQQLQHVVRAFVSEIWRR